MLAIVYQNTGLIYTQKTTKELLISLPGSDIYSLLVLQYMNNFKMRCTNLNITSGLRWKQFEVVVS